MGEIQHSNETIDRPARLGYATHPDERTPEGYVPCPRCESIRVERPAHRWQYGLFGLLQKSVPFLHCHLCGHDYNGKTGGSLWPARILMWVLLAAVLAGLSLARYL